MIKDIPLCNKQHCIKTLIHLNNLVLGASLQHINVLFKQIKKIYSGEITNWKQVGGNDEEIIAFQRNEGSGSQSMLKRFMGDKEIMDAPSEQVNDLMSGIIDVVSKYQNKTSSIGFSFRYYLEGIIKNPDILCSPIFPLIIGKFNIHLIILNGILTSNTIISTIKLIITFIFIT